MKYIDIENVETTVGQVKLVTLRSNHLEVVLTSFGAGIYRMRYDDIDLVTTPKNLDDYLRSPAYYGKTIGRHSGRLQGPHYQIDQHVYDVRVDPDQPFQLHGGQDGLSFRPFTLIGYEHMGGSTNVTFHYNIPSQSDGFPGNLKVDVTYEVTKDDALRISFHATTSAPTICHLTNHIYLNVGHPETILDHLLYVDSAHYLDIDQHYAIKDVKDVVDTPFDFRLPTNIGDRIAKVIQPDVVGYDHCFLLEKHDDQEPVIQLSHDKNNLTVDVMTDYPAVVLYTHNHPAPAPLSHMETNGVHSSLAVECQYPPDGIHHDALNNGILRPGEVYRKFIMIKPHHKK